MTDIILGHADIFEELGAGELGAEDFIQQVAGLFLEKVRADATLRGVVPPDAFPQVQELQL